MVLAELVDEFRRGGRPAARDGPVARALSNGFDAFRLERAADVRPSMLTYRLPLDEAFLARVVRDVGRSKAIARRVGVEWMPRDATQIVPKAESDASWVTREQLKPLDDACTKWCTDTYFPDAFARVNLVANVVRLYDRLRRVGRLRFRIVFKGGVMIRLVLKEFLFDLHVEARQRASTAERPPRHVHVGLRL